MSKTETAENITQDESHWWGHMGWRGIKQDKKDTILKDYGLSQELKEKHPWPSLVFLLWCQSKHYRQGAWKPVAWKQANHVTCLLVHQVSNQAQFTSKDHYSHQCMIRYGSHVWGPMTLSVPYSCSMLNSKASRKVQSGASGHGSLVTGQTGDGFDRLKGLKTHMHSQWRTPLKAFISIRIPGIECERLVHIFQLSIIVSNAWLANVFWVSNTNSRCWLWKTVEKVKGRFF